MPVNHVYTEAQTQNLWIMSQMLNQYEYGYQCPTEKRIFNYKHKRIIKNVNNY